MDGLRGVAAFGFALGLWLALTPLASVAPRFDLLADFILLSSGFICARAHREALSRHEGAARFLVSRVMRFLPLNAAVLSLLLVLATLQGADLSGLAGRDFLASLAFVGILVPGAEGWTPAGWLMAAEVQMSAIFAALCALGLFSGWPGRASILILCAGAATLRLVTPLSPFEDLLARMFVAFLAGVLIHALIAWEPARRAARRAKSRAGTALELWATGSALAFLLFAPAEFAPLAPAAFAPLLLLFLTRKGRAGRALASAWPNALGRLTWPLVTAPALLIAPAARFAEQGGARAETALLFATPAYSCLVLALALVARRWIEEPTQAAMWLWLDRTLPTPSVSRTRWARSG